MHQKRSETLLKKVEVNTDFLISRLQNIIALSASTSTQEIQASEMLQIESNSMMMIRLVEELLSISRTLRENWILGQMPKLDDEDGEKEDVLSGISGKIDLVLDKIVQSVKYDEEVEVEEEEEVQEDEEHEEDEEEKEDKKEDGDDKAEEKKQAGDENKDDVKEGTTVKQESGTSLKSENESKDKPDVNMVKDEESTSSTIKQEESTSSNNDTKQDFTAEIKPEQNDIITIDDGADQTNNGIIDFDNDLQPLTLGSDGNLGEIDFDNFGDLDGNDNNDIIMLD